MMIVRFRYRSCIPHWALLWMKHYLIKTGGIYPHVHVNNVIVVHIATFLHSCHVWICVICHIVPVKFLLKLVKQLLVVLFLLKWHKIKTVNICIQWYPLMNTHIFKLFSLLRHWWHSEEVSNQLLSLFRWAMWRQEGPRSSLTLEHQSGLERWKECMCMCVCVLHLLH